MMRFLSKFGKTRQRCASLSLLDIFHWILSLFQRFWAICQFSVRLARLWRFSSFYSDRKASEVRQTPVSVTFRRLPIILHVASLTRLWKSLDERMPKQGLSVSLNVYFFEMLSLAHLRRVSDRTLIWTRQRCASMLLLTFDSPETVSGAPSTLFQLKLS